MTALETLAADLAARDDDGPTLADLLAAAEPTDDECRFVAYFLTHADPNADPGTADDWPLSTAAAVTFTTTERGRDRLTGQPPRASLLDPDGVPRPWFTDALDSVRAWWRDGYGDANSRSALIGPR
ncbi:hypothetical protein [Flexivirga sp. B27]